jgi:hypothetical protein
LIFTSRAVKPVPSTAVVSAAAAAADFARSVKTPPSIVPHSLRWTSAEGHLLVHMQHPTTGRQERHRELRGRTENSRGESRDDARDQRSVGEDGERA